MNTTFKDEVLKAAAKTKEDKIALLPLADRLQEEFDECKFPENINVDTDEEVHIYVSYVRTAGVLQQCALVLSVNDDINDEEITVVLTEKQVLKFAQKLLNKYEQLNSINEELRGLDIGLNR